MSPIAPGTLFHASPIPGLDLLTPHRSNHGKPLVYLSRRRENVLVYLSNAVERFCQEAGIPHSAPLPKWGSYGFTPEGLLHLDEYYPGATEETYRGVPGFVYWAEDTGGFRDLPDIPFAVASEEPVPVVRVEFIQDAYEELLRAAAEGKILLTRYEENSREMLEWILRSVRLEYESSPSPEYRTFLRTKFPSAF